MWSKNILLFDALSSLYRGNLLVKAGPSSFLTFLDGVPLVYIVAPTLLDQKLVELIPNSEIQYQITEKGKKWFHYNHEWYYSMPVWTRILGRFGFPVK